MRRIAITIPLAVLSLGLSATLAFADTIHNISVSFDGNTVTATGDISGLGSQKPAYAVLSANGFATYECSNQGGNAAPGQNPVPVQGSSAPQDLGNTTHNGRGTVNVSVTVTAPQTINPKTAGCPNGKTWTATLQSVTLTSATLTIYQGNPNNVIFQQTYYPPA
jgi:hypothetical protein